MTHNEIAEIQSVIQELHAKRRQAVDAYARRETTTAAESEAHKKEVEGIDREIKTLKQRLST